MPTKKKTKKKKGTRRRRIGAMSSKTKMNIAKVAAIAGGFLVADKVNGAITKAAGTINPKIIAGAEVAAGAALMFMGKDTVVKAVAGGALAGMGLKLGLKSFGIMNGGLTGYGDVPVIGRRLLSGYQDVPVIGGFSPSGTLNGYAVNGYSRNQNVMGSTGSGLCRRD